MSSATIELIEDDEPLKAPTALPADNPVEDESTASASEEESMHDPEEADDDGESFGIPTALDAEAEANALASGPEVPDLHDGGEYTDDAYFDNLPKDAARAMAAKERGNACFGRGDYEAALDSYAEALLTVPDQDITARVTYHSNKAAAHFMLEQWEDVVYECSQAIALEPRHLKAIVRRGRAYERLDRPSEAVEDFKLALEIDPSDKKLAARVPVLEKEAAEKFEKQKDEMLDKLKGFGNAILGKFGMSLDQFQAVKDPNTGSYSISFGNAPPAAEGTSTDTDAGAGQ